MLWHPRELASPSMALPCGVLLAEPAMKRITATKGCLQCDQNGLAVIELEPGHELVE
jgi:hypothetical protein